METLGGLFGSGLPWLWSYSVRECVFAVVCCAMMQFTLLCHLRVCMCLNLYFVLCCLYFQSVGLKVLVCCICVCIRSVIVVLGYLLHVLETFIPSPVCCILSEMLNIYIAPAWSNPCPITTLGSTLIPRSQDL